MAPSISSKAIISLFIFLLASSPSVSANLENPSKPLVKQCCACVSLGPALHDRPLPSQPQPPSNQPPPNRSPPNQLLANPPTRPNSPQPNLPIERSSEDEYEGMKETLIEVVERALAQDPAVEHTRSLEYAAMKRELLNVVREAFDNGSDDTARSSLSKRRGGGKSSVGNSISHNSAPKGQSAPASAPLTPNFPAPAAPPAAPPAVHPPSGPPASPPAQLPNAPYAHPQGASSVHSPGDPSAVSSGAPSTVHPPHAPPVQSSGDPSVHPSAVHPPSAPPAESVPHSSEVPHSDESTIPYGESAPPHRPSTLKKAAQNTETASNIVGSANDITTSVSNIGNTIEPPSSFDQNGPTSQNGLPSQPNPLAPPGGTTTSQNDTQYESEFVIPSGTPPYDPTASGKAVAPGAINKTSQNNSTSGDHSNKTTSTSGKSKRALKRRGGTGSGDKGSSKGGPKSGSGQGDIAWSNIIKPAEREHNFFDTTYTYDRVQEQPGPRPPLPPGRVVRRSDDCSRMSGSASARAGAIAKCNGKRDGSLNQVD